MKIVVHADDFGLSVGVTDGIIAAYCKGRLDRVGIVPNGIAFDYAIESLTNRADLECSIHLNLIEGSPVSNKGEIPLLVNRAGIFKHLFLSLWLLYIFFSGKRQMIIEQVEREINAQLQRVRFALKKGRISIDSHQHVHLLPFIFDILVRHADNWGIKEIRILNEPFILPESVIKGLGIVFALNPVKYLLLRFLSRRNVNRQKAMRISHPDYFFGILFSGKMTTEGVRKVLTKIQKKNPMHDSSIELLFHPGQASDFDYAFWNEYKYRKFYFSRDRTKELRVITSPQFAEMVSEYRANPI